MNTHLANAFTYRLDVSRIIQRKFLNLRIDSGSRLPVSQFLDSYAKNLSLLDNRHKKCSS
jgi:hypothetical protein